MSTELSARMQDYLETILDLQADRPVVRTSEIADAMDVSRPSATSAVQTLSEQGYVRHESYGYVQLTAGGRRAAEGVRRRHRMLRRFLHHVLGMPEEQASEDACRLEHDISPLATERLGRFAEFLERCPRCGPDWLGHFHCFAERGASGAAEVQRCAARCAEACLAGLQDHPEGLCAGQTAEEESET